MAILEINYKNIRNNVKQLKKDSKEIIAIVKNNAYNMGLEDCVKLFYSEGITYFATTKLEEAKRIRTILGNDVNIFLLNATTNFEDVKKFNIEINVPSLEYLKTNLDFLKNITLQLEFAGSMRRAGAKNYEEALAIAEFCRENNLNLIGFWSHFAFSDEFDGNYEKERELVLDVYNKLSKIYKFEVVHLQNSASYLRDGAFDVVTHIRPGILLYGAYPYDVENRGSYINYVANHPIKVFANIVNIVTLKKGECIGYSNAYVAGEEEKVAVVDIGYGDGILKTRLLGHTCLINNKEHKIVAVMMSHIIVKCDDEMKIGDEVIVYNDKLPVYKYIKYCGVNSEQLAVLNMNSLEVRKIYN